MLTPLTAHCNRWLIVGIAFAVFALPLNAQRFTRTDLTADAAHTSSTATNLDANLVNAWGLARSSGSPWWISDNGAGLTTLYNATGAPQSLVVKIPLPGGATGNSAPTGMVSNYTTNFQLVPGKQASFLFVTEDGTIAGWNSSVNATNAAILVDRSGLAIYKGCTLAQTVAGTLFYATNFLSGKVEVFDGQFHKLEFPSFAFHYPGLPSSWSPFNIQNVGGNLLVTFAKRQNGSTDEQHGAGLGRVGIFDVFGNFLAVLQEGSWFNAPWGIAMAPSDFGAFSHRLLIGNFGDGMIHAFNVLTGRMEGALLDSNGQPLSIDGLWALSFGGDGTNNGPANNLFFTAGPNDEGDGLFGKIAAVSTDQRGNNE